MNIKKLIPNSLYSRFLMLIVIPILIVQLVSIYVFYYTHIDIISKHMARSVIAEMVFIKNSVSSAGHDKLLKEFAKSVDLNFLFERKSYSRKKKIADSKWRKKEIREYISPLIDPYNRFKSELDARGLTPYEIFKNREDDNYIIVEIETKQGFLTFDVPVKRITSSTSHIFTFWMVITAVITSIIAILFLRNQIRSIRNLSEAADKFGRGQTAPNLKPTGSKEIRSLAISFIKMKERISRQISQRTDMLSAVSHDLRTPLTRMKLQLEMMPESQEVSDLKQDISDMEKLVNEYLDFARLGDKKKTELVLMNAFLQTNIVNYYAKMKKKIINKIDLPEDFTINIRPPAIRRALVNLIDNAFNYGKKVSISAHISSRNLIITIDDDGPGIPANERTNVLKPFYRIDDSRNLDKKIVSGGSGLGLAIANDIANSHGGRLRLFESPTLGGLRVMIFLPI